MDIHQAKCEAAHQRYQQSLQVQGSIPPSAVHGPIDTSTPGGQGVADAIRRVETQRIAHATKARNQ